MTKADLEARARGMVGRAAVGQEHTVRTGKNATIRGTVKEVTFNRIKTLRNGDMVAVFNLVLVCGTNKNERTFPVRGFPSR